MTSYISVQCPHCGKEAARLGFGESQPSTSDPQRETAVRASEEAKLRSIYDLELGVRLHNSLKNNLPSDVQTIGDLIKYTPSELLRMKTMGRRDLNALIEVLGILNLSLAPDPRPEIPPLANGSAANL